MAELKINKMISAYNYNVGNIGRIKYIVIHYVGALGGAKANCEYYGGGNRGASAHYFVDHSGEIWQCIEDKDVAWHCGAKSYKHPECRNANSIGIELCVRKCDTSSMGAEDRDWYFEDATVQAAAELTRQLMTKYGVPADHVIRHYDVTGKICPNPYVYNEGSHTWNEFQGLIGGSTAGCTGATGTIGTATESDQVVTGSENKEKTYKMNTLKRNSTGNDVTIFESIMKKMGYYTGAIDTTFGPKCVAACNAFQKKYPECGTNGQQDGSFGPKCWSKALSLLR